MKYKKETKEVIKSIEAYLIEKYGKVNDEWRLTLNLLQDNIQLYKDCMDSISINGIFNASTGRKNPLLSTTKDLQATITKQIQHLGISPYAASKIKQEVEDNTEDFLEALTNE